MELQFKIGGAILMRNSNFYGKLIQLGNWLHYRKKGWTHAAIIGEVREGSVIVYEALDRGFIKSEYGKGELKKMYDEGRVLLGNVNLPLKDVRKNCEKYLGTPYGWTDIFRIAKYTIFGRISLKSDTRDLICSEAVAKILYDSSDRRVNFQTEFNKPYSYITPQDLRESRYLKWQGEQK